MFPTNPGIFQSNILYSLKGPYGKKTIESETVYFLLYMQDYIICHMSFFTTSLQFAVNVAFR